VSAPSPEKGMMKHIFGRGYAWIDTAFGKLEVVCVSFLLVLSVLVILADISSRVVLGTSVSWAPELARYAIIWMVFIGGSIAARQGAHISIDVALEVLPSKLGRKVLFAASVTAAITCAIISYLGVKLVSQMTMFSQKSPSLEISMWMVYLIIPISFAMMTVRFVQAGFAIKMDERRMNLATSAG
jgi:C4-dicarboxylate transporter DctQ subunit